MAVNRLIECIKVSTRMNQVKISPVSNVKQWFVDDDDDFVSWFVFFFGVCWKSNWCWLVRFGFLLCVNIFFGVDYLVINIAVSRLRCSASACKYLLHWLRLALIGFDWLRLAWNFYCVKDYCQLVLWIGLDWLRFYFKYLLTWLWLGWEYLRDWLDSVGLALSHSYYNSFIKLDGIN